jgi:DNA-binding winged helix-turn-helix (wHTH) protein/tetratricopeptide (TPR) repeat protein/TolB-like protein
MESKLGSVFAFSIFVFDCRTGELRRNGRPLRIPDQVARLLTILIESGGDMVSREDLRRQLWPAGEVVDFDHSINRAVCKLRAVLRDRSAKSANYIETIPKRGYRFTAELHEVPAPHSSETKAPPVQQSIIAVAPEAAVAISSPFFSRDTVWPHAVVEQPLSASSAIELAWSAPADLPRPAKWLAFRRYRWPAVAVATATVLAAVFGIRQYQSHRAMAAHPLSLGIVPFVVSGDGAGNLAESFRFDLADSLSQIPAIEIRAAHSFDDLAPPAMADESQIQARAQRLNISTILFGRFTLAGDQVQLHLELVRSSDGVHLFSLQYVCSKDQLASVRDRIDRDIFQRLDTSGRADTLTLARPVSPRAYEAYLQGRSYLSRWTDSDLQLAIQNFKDALQIDPNYAQADAGLSSAYFILSQHGSADRNGNLEKARTYATQALALDRSLAEAHAMLGEVALSKDWNFREADEQLLQATELDPFHAANHQWLSILDCTEGKYDLALQQIDQAHAADPDWAPPYMTEIYIADTARQFDRADRAAEILLRKMPDWPLAHEQNAYNLWASGRYAAAIEEWHRAAVLGNNPDRARLEEQGAEAFRSGGVAAYARVRLNAIATRKGISYEEYDFVPAEWHAYAGDWKDTMAELRSLLESHSTEALQIAANPAYQPLHKNPEFTGMLHQFGLGLPAQSF